MKKPAGYETAQAYTSFEKIKPGAYVVKIQSAEEVEGQYGSRLNLVFDIAEGDFANYYTEQYKSSNFENAKYKGNFAIFLPKEDGSEQDEKTLRRLKTSIGIIEDSNPGFHWDWDEKKLSGLVVGMTFQDKEWNYNGKTGFTAQPYGLATVYDVREGKIKTPEPKTSSGTSQNSFKEVDDNGDLPF